MTDNDYFSLLARGYIEHSSYLAAHILRRCDEAQSAGIEPEEFFERLADAYYKIEHFFEEALYQAEAKTGRQINMEHFTIPLWHLLSEYDLDTAGAGTAMLGSAMLRYLQNAIKEAWHKKEDQQEPSQKNAREILREYHLKEGELTSSRVKELAIQHGKSPDAWVRKYNNFPTKWKDVFNEEMKRFRKRG